MISYILAVISAVLLLGADQLTKYSVSTEFALGEQREFLKGFIDLTYIHNRGGAWGMLYGKTYILIPVTVIVMAVCIILYKKPYGIGRFCLQMTILDIQYFVEELANVETKPEPFFGTQRVGVFRGHNPTLV